MARGFLAGVVWGTVVSGIGAGTLSVVAQMPVPANDAPVSDTSAELAAPLDAPVEAPVAMPQVEADAPEAPATPDAAPSPEAPEPASDAPVATAPDPALPQPQPQDSAPVADPAQTAAPDVGPDIGDAPQAPAGPEADAPLDLAVAADAPVTPAGQSAAPAAAAPDQPPVVETDPAAPPAPQPQPQPAPEPEPEPQPAPEPEVVVNTPDPEPETAGPSIGKPAGSLLDKQAVPTGRLATITADAPEEQADAPQVAALPADSPLVKFAAEVDVAADVPRMAVVVIDDGSTPLGPDTLEAFPFPLTIALGPEHPNAAEAAVAYRKLGFDILAIGAVPEGATPSDVEVTLAGLVSAVPEAVGILEAPTGGLQQSRDISDQTTSFLKESGHGIVMMPKGMDTAQKLALKDGVPAVTLFRDIDGAGQDGEMIKRTLNQAAFRARQEGAVVMLARLSADTMSQLTLWGLQDRTGSVALVPVSTVLTEAVTQ
ncbi:polysaccharide deacteylase family 2 protein [Tropicibacter naphthalenivorans]|uniref:Divergent polysaccharide deacetylase n=1 Tax=Tropicibacter naphthalenivorans TaxID=441103 RepID=A0A0P1G5C7_9RHOB|nr:polysaccharide deacteylase family 2 protein [Tropicibacter naphthalenivorans]CUH76885.1 Divergent polysaccharide deacetylase [Tropicibacter naphthalenivorans]SMC62510.1 Uncharacterized conserved protein YibQ, putative polysaccharide deacetylase 2 family [Tropicibacter naphthalenivorans]